MRASRPTSVTVMAIFHFIVAGLGLLCTVSGSGNMGSSTSMMGGFGAAQQNKQQEEMVKAQQEMIKAMEKIPYAQAYTIANLVVSILFSIALVVAGIGLLQCKLWGRTVSLVYAVLSIVAKILVAYYTLTYFIPGFEEAMKVMVEVMRKQPKEGEQLAQFMTSLVSGMKIFIGATPFISMIYPLCVLLVLGRSSVKVALSGGIVSAPEQEYYDDRTEVDKG